MQKYMKYLINISDKGMFRYLKLHTLFSFLTEYEAADVWMTFENVMHALLDEAVHSIR